MATYNFVSVYKINKDADLPLLNTVYPVSMPQDDLCCGTGWTNPYIEEDTCNMASRSLFQVVHDVFRIGLNGEISCLSVRFVWTHSTWYMWSKRKLENYSQQFDSLILKRARISKMKGFCD